MAVWFSRDHLYVTDDLVRSGGMTYPTGAIRDARLRRAPFGSLNAIWGGVTATLVIVALDAGLGAVWGQRAPVVLVSAGLGLLIGLAVGLATRRVEVWITLPTGEVPVWQGYDRIEANKALRAVRRACEHHRTPASDYFVDSDGDGT